MATIGLDDIDQFIQLSGPLFEEVQQSGIFADSKTFVDAVPTSHPDEIIKEYQEQKEQSDFVLEEFVRKHFQIPGEEDITVFESSKTMDTHIKQLWEHLSRQPDENVSDFSTLIPLPHPYIVPGGRFREIYYWDTYFTARGLAAAGKLDMVTSLTRNFKHLIEKTGHVPNGNRFYYVSRSQPPFFALLIDLVEQHRGDEAIQEFLPALKTEYDFWMDGHESISEGDTHRRVVNEDGDILNRYWDDRPLPREESWNEDKALTEGLNPDESAKRYRNLRAAAESGWDFSSRWFRNAQTLNTIRTTDILPVDLNALLYAMESRLGKWSDGEEANHYRELARKRKQVFDRYFWNSSKGYYFDYDWREGEQTGIWSLAGIYPLFLELSSEEQARSVAREIENKFLKKGGLITTLHQTAQQWDSPNGWAPLQWVAIRGLMNYGYTDLARAIAKRWIDLNGSVFNRTGKMMEKYNVCDLTLEAGGGEYPLQDGFGWTNGIVVALKKLLDSGDL